MSRSGYSFDPDNWDLIRWRGAVNSAIRGSRGQAFLRDLLAALDAMPAKRLIANEFSEHGEFCTLGVIGHARGIDLTQLDTEDTHGAAAQFGIARALVAEIMFMNDDGEWRRNESPEYRWVRMRRWVADLTTGRDSL